MFNWLFFKWKPTCKVGSFLYSICRVLGKARVVEIVARSICVFGWLAKAGQIRTA